MEFPIQLLDTLVAIRPEEPKRSKILLPDWQKSLFGFVLSVGPGVTELTVGERVSFGAAKGIESVCDGAQIRILREEDIDFTVVAA